MIITLMVGVNDRCVVFMEQPLGHGGHVPQSYINKSKVLNLLGKHI